MDPELIGLTITNPNLLANAYLPALILLFAFAYSLYFAYTRRRYFIVVASAIFLVGSFHQFGELETWRRTGELPAPDWLLGDASETLVYLLAVIGFLLFTYFYDRTQGLLEEKDRLLNEINHRVKNNLQMIESLLSHRMNKPGVAPSTEEELRKVRDRIRSFSSLYEKLHQTESVESVDARIYIEELCTMFSNHLSEDNGLTLNTDLESRELSVEEAISCGLIINELVTNTLKYAEAKEAPLTVRIRFECDYKCRLTVEDNGTTFNRDSALEQSGGFELIRQITEFDLNGQFTLEDNQFMKATVTFSPRG